MSDTERSQQAALTGAPMEIIDRLLKERRELITEIREMRKLQAVYSAVGFLLGILVMVLAYYKG